MSAKKFPKGFSRRKHSATATEPDIARAAAALPDLGFLGIQMAYLDRFHEQHGINEFGQVIANDHGVNVRLFNDQAAADQWLSEK